MELINLKAWELREKLYKGEISAREIVEAHLKRIEDVDKDINAFIAIDKEGALAQANRVDEKIRNKEELGALAGLPIGIKDNIITKNLKTTCGSRMLEHFIPPYDATVVEKIKNADGIIIGKTNLDEFAMGPSTETSYFGATKNPVNSNLVPGGSSGGSAAAVASKVVSLALGSDTGGSVTQPASFCGIVGIKPTYGLVSRYGLVSVANTLDVIGVMGRDVKDAVLMLNAITGHDKKDPTSVNKSYESITFEEDNDSYNPIDFIKGMKIGVPKEIFEVEMDSKVKDEFLKSVELFRQNGAVIEEVSLPNLKYGIETYQIISSAEAASNLGRFDGLRYGYRAKEYGTLDELFIKSRTEAFGDEVKRRIIMGTYLLSSRDSNGYYNKALKLRTLIKNDFDNVFANYDIILMPTYPVLPFELNSKSNNSRNMSNGDIFTVPVNLAGICSMNMPTNIGEELPVGIQIIGDRFKEVNIIKAGLAFERLVK